MSIEEEKLLQEILFGNIFQEQPASITAIKYSQKKNETYQLFRQLCQGKLKSNFDGNEIVEMYNFIEKVDTVFSKNPLVDIQKFVNEFVSGIHTKELLSKYLIPDYNRIYPVLRILELKTKRIKSNSGISVANENLKDSKISDVYEFIQKYSKIFNDELKLLCSIGWIRLNIIGYIISNQNSVTIPEDKLIMQALSACKNITFETEEEYSKISNKLNELGINPLDELIEKNIIIKNESSNDGSTSFSIKNDLLNFEEFILNFMKKSNGVVVYSNLVDHLFDQNPLCHYAPLASLWGNTLNELEKQEKIKRRQSFWRWSPYQDQYTLTEMYDENIKQVKDEIKNQPEIKKFFGREMDSQTFLKDLDRLDKGDLDDDDDQVTRIAGMVLANSSMLMTPREDLDIFDFMMDLGNFVFTNEQQAVMSKTKIILNAQILHIKIMINDLITKDIIHEIKQKLPSGHQAMIITITPTYHINIHNMRLLLPKDNSIQIVDRTQFEEWLKITPVIPARKNSICKVRYGSNMNRIVQISSINYETAMATFRVFPYMIESSDYIGGLEEILPNVSDPGYFFSLQKNYADILLRLTECSSNKDFNEAMSLKIESSETLNQEKKYDGIFYEKKYTFENDDNYVILDDLASPHCTYRCTCDAAIYNNMWENSLCHHQIAALNRKCFDEALFNETWDEKNILTTYFTDIENPHRHSSQLDNSAKCPHCGKIAENTEDIEKEFGFRHSEGSVRSQSWCRDCRSKK